MPTYLERYLAGEREEVWAELSARGPAICEEPLFAEAHAVARETMTRARANVALLIQRLTSHLADGLRVNQWEYRAAPAESRAPGCNDRAVGARQTKASAQPGRVLCAARRVGGG